MDIYHVVDSYLSWIKDNTFINAISGDQQYKITVPFLDRHNDHVEIYIKEIDNGFRLTDDGFTIADLKMSGLNIDSSPKRDQIFKTILNGYGVKVDDDKNLYVDATLHNIGQKKHYLIQAILSVNDMFTLSEESVHSLFKEDVERFFRSEDILYTKDIKITGKSGLDHNIDFVIPATRTRQERLIKTINKAKKDTVMNALFSFSDLAEVRENTPSNIVIYNDFAHVPSQDILGAFNNYAVEGIAWSLRSEHRQSLLTN